MGITLYFTSKVAIIEILSVECVFFSFLDTAKFCVSKTDVSETTNGPQNGAFPCLRTPRESAIWDQSGRPQHMSFATA